jgi:two-component system, NtrC family, sensor kinase
MKLWSSLKPGFWDYEDIIAGPTKHLFNFRRMWKWAVLLTTAVALVPLILMAVVDYNVHQHAIEADINYQTGRLVSNTRRSITFFLAERKSALNFIDKDNTYPMLCSPQRLAALLENLKKGFGGFTDLGVIDDHGTQHNYVGPFALAGADYSDQEWFQDLMNSGAHISDVFMGFRHQPHLVVAAKHELPEGGFFVLRASIDTEQFNHLLAEMDVSGKGDIFLVNQAGMLQTPSRLFGPPLQKIPIEIPEYSDKTQVIQTELYGAPLVLGYAYIQGTPFILMAAKSKNELMKPWDDTRRKLILFLSLSVTLILLVVLGVSTYLVNQVYAADHKRIMALHHIEYANKMASLGRLSAGVAHEINNPLAIINEKAGLIRDLIAMGIEVGNHRVTALIDSILYSVDRCAQVTKRLLSFARQGQDGLPQKLRLDEVAKEVIGFISQAAELQGASISIDADPTVPEIESNRGKLQEIFLNLVNNSLAAMAGEGRVDIRIRNSSDGKVSIKVADTGCGIPAADLQRIFEPFFSTKIGKGGTGLGLSITYGLIQELGGRIEVQSTVGKGTEFTIWLPHRMASSKAGRYECSIS